MKRYQNDYEVNIFFSYPGSFSEYMKIFKIWNFRPKWYGHLYMTSDFWLALQLSNIFTYFETVLLKENEILVLNDFTYFLYKFPK